MNELEYQKLYHEAYSSFIRMMDKELDNAGCKYADQYANRILSEYAYRIVSEKENISKSEDFYDLVDEIISRDNISEHSAEKEAEDILGYKPKYSRDSLD